MNETQATRGTRDTERVRFVRLSTSFNSRKNAVDERAREQTRLSKKASIVAVAAMSISVSDARPSHRSLNDIPKTRDPRSGPNGRMRQNSPCNGDVPILLVFRYENHMIHAGLQGGAAVRSCTLLARSSIARSLIGFAKQNNCPDESKHHVYKNEPRSHAPRTSTSITVSRVGTRDRVSPMRPRYRLSRAGGTIRDPSTASARQPRFYR